jgi:hypothetical protein
VLTTSSSRAQVHRPRRSSDHEREAEERLTTYAGHGLENPQAQVELAGFDHLDQRRQVGVEQLNCTATRRLI